MSSPLSVMKNTRSWSWEDRIGAVEQHLLNSLALDARQRQENTFSFQKSPDRLADTAVQPLVAGPVVSEE